MEYGLGRLPSPRDPRDYLMADAVRALEKVSLPRPVKRWHSDRVLNQGLTPHCVGFSFAGWGIACPVEDKWTDCMGHSIYRECKVIDGEPGAENGSTLRSGAKVMAHRGRIKTYFFAASVDEALDYLARFGPVVAGTVWTEDMFKPSLVGKIIRPTGPVKGGHAYLLIGVDSRYVTIRNSWGTAWGKDGDARISIAHLKAIFKQDGELCAATEKALPIGGTHAAPA
jgi:hypothetical protein